jgi:hypothetical protein
MARRWSPGWKVARRALRVRIVHRVGDIAVLEASLLAAGASVIADATATAR